LRKQLSKESADAYRERVKQGREAGHPRPELQFIDLERRSGFNIDEFRAGIEAQYNHQASAYYSTARLWDDGIIDPKKTREVLGLSFYIAARDMGTKSNFGVFRM
jgi:3-methylcrotonyl-CoA carboxylase beta subunit